MSPSLGPTRILVLQNLVGPEELADDEEYEEILADVHAELSKFGDIKTIVAPRPPPQENANEFDAFAASAALLPAGVGKIFVEFAEATAAKAAEQKVRGRKFNNRIVITAYFSEKDFQQKKYS